MVRNEIIIPSRKNLIPKKNSRNVERGREKQEKSADLTNEVDMQTLDFSEYLLIKVESYLL